MHKLSLLLLIISHCSTPKIRELLLSVPNGDAVPIRRERLGGTGKQVQKQCLTRGRCRVRYAACSAPDCLRPRQERNGFLPVGVRPLPRHRPCPDTSPAGVSTRTPLQRRRRQHRFPSRKSPPSFTSSQTGVHKAEVDLPVGGRFRKAPRGCFSSHMGGIFSRPTGGS